MTDVSEVPDSELARMALVISSEQERRRLVASLPERMAELEEDAERAGVDITDLRRTPTQRGRT